MAILVLCWRLEESNITLMSQVWIDYAGDTITWLMQFPFQ